MNQARVLLPLNTAHRTRYRHDVVRGINKICGVYVVDPEGDAFDPLCAMSPRLAGKEG